MNQSFKKYKTLILLTDNYPYGFGEAFIDTELNVLSDYFETIIVYSLNRDKTILRARPSNLLILNSSSPSRLKMFKFGLDAFFSRKLWSDFLSVKNYFGHTPSWQHFKILMMDFINAKNIAYELKNYCVELSINISSTIFYSYWFDSKALALCLMKSNNSIRAFARAHGWDVDYKRHNPSYLPWKNFLITNLNQTISISEFGKSRIFDITNPTYHKKVIKSPLGVKNLFSPIIIKNNLPSYLFCSCSSLIELKRVDYIINTIAKLKLGRVNWIHFGDGPQRAELENLAQMKGLNASFRGNISNSKILEFYAKNYVDLFLNMSTSEGIPVSIMEAQSAGIPVLATNVGGTSEIINDENGFLIEKDFKFDDVALIIENFLKSSTENIQKKRHASFENWHKYYNAENNYKEFLKLLTS